MDSYATAFSHKGLEWQTFCLLSFSIVSSSREVILTGFVNFALYCLFITIMGEIDLYDQFVNTDSLQIQI